MLEVLGGTDEGVREGEEKEKEEVEGAGLERGLGEERAARVGKEERVVFVVNLESREGEGAADIEGEEEEEDEDKSVEAGFLGEDREEEEGEISR